MPYVNQLNAIADQVGEVSAAALCEQVRQVYGGLTGLLLPHMEAVEAAVYPTLQGLFSDLGATAPMAREHAEIRRLVAAIGRFLRLPEAAVGAGERLAIRRALFRLYALLKVHLAEEAMYLPILQHNLTAERARELACALEHVVGQGL